MDPNERTVIALRKLADRLEGITLPIGNVINAALSDFDATWGDDADRLLGLILTGARAR